MYTEWKRTEFPPKVLSMNFETKRLRGRPRNRWQDEVTKDGRLVGGTGWRERLHNREEWKTSWWNWVEGKSTQQRGMED